MAYITLFNCRGNARQPDQLHRKICWNFLKLFGSGKESGTWRICRLFKVLGRLRIELWIKKWKSPQAPAFIDDADQPINCFLLSLLLYLSCFKFQNSDSAIKQNTAVIADVLLYHKKECLEVNGKLFQGSNNNSSKYLCVDPWDTPSKLVFFSRIELNYCVRVSCTELTLDSWLEHPILNGILHINKFIYQQICCQLICSELLPFPIPQKHFMNANKSF